MEMHGSVSTFGVGDLEAIVHSILGVGGRTMAHFFIFEAVIIMSMGPDMNRCGWFFVIRTQYACLFPLTDSS